MQRVRDAGISIKIIVSQVDLKDGSMKRSLTEVVCHLKYHQDFR